MIKKLKCRLGHHLWEDETDNWGTYMSSYCDRDECWTNTGETFFGNWSHRLKPFWTRKKKEETS